MVDLSNRCLFCDSDHNLNTFMSVKIDNIKYDVAICEEHEDEASPKAVREIVQQKAGEIAKIKEMAAKYGLTIAEKLDQAPQAPQAPQPPRKTAAQPSGHRNMHRGLRKQSITRPDPQEPVEQPPAEEPIEDGAETANVERYSGYTKKADAPHITAQQSQVIKTESGREVVVPSVLYDDLGTKTSIRIVNSGGDRALQSRFKDLADASKGNRGPDFRNQYSVRDCTACGGTGRSRINKNNTCPKCGGDGFLK